MTSNINANREWAIAWWTVESTNADDRGRRVFGVWFRSGRVRPPPRILLSDDMSPDMKSKPHAAKDVTESGLMRVIVNLLPSSLLM